MQADTKKKLYFLILVVFFFLVVFVTPFIGSQSLNYHQVVAYLSKVQTPDGIIFFAGDGHDYREHSGVYLYF